ncbi:TraR/DksA C4-type zinc finger protein [Dickeya dianthicola]|uniref:TraR/DksA C4-type zinc finger protein n=1 Tax=Dickeya dianthicola TaxID=204039 RepID=UPI00301A3440
MSHDIDDELAQAVTQQLLDISLNKIRSQAQASVNGPSLMQCEECGNEIPEARRKAINGVRLCVGCQSVLEFHQHVGTGKGRQHG